MKTHVLIVSEYFPKTHYKSGEKTDFVDSIKKAIKIHTIRGNYEFWKKRITEIENGYAILSVRIWSGKPYNSKQEEVFQFNQYSGIGVQKIWLPKNRRYKPFVKTDLFWRFLDFDFIAHNDGLGVFDFRNWFKYHDDSKPFAIIHFTSFRY